MTGERRKKIASIPNKIKKTKHTTVDLVLASTFAHTCRDRKKVSKIAISVERVERLSKQRKILKMKVCTLRYIN
jgi:hypothetical protein